MFMAEDKLHNMQSKLGIPDLDDGNRKDLFQRFVDSGGKVVDLNKAKEAELLKQRAAMKGIPIAPDGGMSKQSGYPDKSQKAAPKAVITPSIAEEMKKNPINKMIERFSARMGCTFSGILSFFSKKFKSSFVSLICEKYQNTLLESRMILASVIYQNQMIASEIKKRLANDPSQPFLYELLHRYDKLFDEELFNRLGSMKVDPFCVDDMKPFILTLFKPLYVMKSYAETLRRVTETALLYEKELRRLDSGITFNNSRSVNANITFIFQKVYPRLFSLIDYYYKEDTRDKEISFNNYIKITDEDSIGTLTQKWKEEVEFEAVKEHVKESIRGEEIEGEAPSLAVSASGSSVPSHVIQEPLKKGLELIIKHVNFINIINAYREKKDLRALFGMNDKVFLTYSLVDFFDKEYSSIFTASKVKFNVILNYGNRQDVKKELADAYYRINSIFERVNEYLKVIREIRKIETDGYLSLEERSGRMNQHSIQRSQISRALRKDARSLFENFSKTLLFIVNDFDTNKSIVQNPDDVLEFNQRVDGHRVIHGNKVIDIIRDAYYLSFTIHYLLLEGDLGGSSVVLEKPIYLPVRME